MFFQVYKALITHFIIHFIVIRSRFDLQVIKFLISSIWIRPDFVLSLL